MKIAIPRSFRTILTLIIVAAATIPVVVLAYPAIHRISALVAAGTSRELELATTNVAEALHYELARIGDQASAVAADSDVRRGIKTVLFVERADLRLGELLTRNPVAGAALLIGIDGKVVTGIPESVLALATPKALVDAAVTLTVAPQAASHATFLSFDAADYAAGLRQPQSLAHSGRLLVALVPVPGMVGRPGGTLAVVVPAERLAAVARETAPGYATIDLLDASGSLLATPLRGPEVSGDQGDGIRAAATLPDTLRGLRGQTDEPAMLRVGLTASSERSLAPVRSTIAVLSGLVVWVVALLALAGFYVARLLLRPLAQLNAQAEAYGTGRYTAPLPEVAFAEFADLAATLHFMAGRILRHIEAERAQLEAELAALRAQMSPHFLFNTLNAIATTIAIDQTRAAAMLERLASLYRLILEASKSVLSPLARELEIVAHYLELEAMRFGKRLRYLIEAPPALANTLKIPGLMVQTLVENAVKHGIAKAREGGEIRVQVSVAGPGRYRLQVTNTGAPYRAPNAGAGDDAVSRSGAGIGVRNTIKRLDLIYGPTHEFSIKTTAAGETEVSFIFTDAATIATMG